MQLRHVTGHSDLPFATYAGTADAFAAAHAAQFAQIEARIAATDATGKHPLWAGYKDQPGYHANASRRASDVRTGHATSVFYAWLAQQLAPDAIVEIGTAFGGSGMYWLTGLEIAQTGHLYAFEPNDTWSHIARANLASVSDRFTLTTGPFEDHSSVVHTPPSLGLIDAIHTPDFVRMQLEILRGIAAPGAVVVLDDIHFSPDMKAYWRRLTRQPYVAAAWQFGARTGLIQLAP
ncbi:MAG: class I SAM-dependent methyltransferase [Pseudomonadota bacterium]